MLIRPLFVVWHQQHVAVALALGDCGLGLDICGLVHITALCFKKPGPVQDFLITSTNIDQHR